MLAYVGGILGGHTHMRTDRGHGHPGGEAPNYAPVPEPSYDLIPEPRYASALGASIAVLEGQRVTLRRDLALGAVPGTVQRLATRLAAGFADTATSLAQLKPSLATSQAQTMLSRSILRARDAYAALAAAAGAQSPSRFATARGEVHEAETSINDALESFALLGTGRSGLLSAPVSAPPRPVETCYQARRSRPAS